MGKEGRPKKKTNPLLGLTQRELLAYRDRPGEYDNDHLYEALGSCAGLEDLSDEERNEREAFIEILEVGRNFGWLSHYFANRSEGPEEIFQPFSAAEVVASMADAENIDLGNPKTQEHRMDTARSFVEFYTPIIAEYLELLTEEQSDGTRILEKVPPNKYRVTAAGAELFADDGEPLPEA